MTKTDMWRFELDCNLAAVPEVAAEARRFLEAHGCSDPEASACELALVEACNNAIVHSQPSPAGKPIAIQVRCQPREIELRITDHTEGFDWPARIDLPPEDHESGRGLYLIAAVMDSTTYRRGAGQNVLILHRKRNQSQAGF